MNYYRTRQTDTDSYVLAGDMNAARQLRLGQVLINIPLMAKYYVQFPKKKK